MAEAFEVAVVEEGPYLRVRATGTYAAERVRQLIERVAAEAGRRGARRVLLDAYDVIGGPSTMDRYAQGVEAARQFKFRTACIVRREYVDYFSETVARNRGANVRIFTDEPSACAWLVAD